MVDVQNMTDVLSTTLTGAVENTIANTQEVLPGLLYAIIIFVIGWIVAFIVSRIFGGLLKAINLEKFLKDHRVGDALGRVRISDVLVKILKYYVLLIFLQAAVSFIALGTISSFLTDVLIYAPVLIAALLVVLTAVILGEYIKHSILDLHVKSPMVRLVARASKLIVIYVGVTMALGTAGIDTALPKEIFTIILAGIVFAVSFATAIAFGLGGQKDAQDLIGKWRKHLKV